MALVCCSFSEFWDFTLFWFCLISWLFLHRTEFAFRRANKNDIPPSTRSFFPPHRTARKRREEEEEAVLPHGMSPRLPFGQRRRKQDTRKNMRNSPDGHAPPSLPDTPHATISYVRLSRKREKTPPPLESFLRGGKAEKKCHTQGIPTPGADGSMLFWGLDFNCMVPPLARKGWPTQRQDHRKIG